MTTMPKNEPLADAPDLGVTKEASPEKQEAVRIVIQALELSIEKGKIKPFQALETGAYFGITLPSWIERKHAHYVRQTQAATEAAKS